ncbi:MAG: nuclear transport factor 2 family protein [Candidatus Eremiobacteraeota bacterium]|nr:nuclear transport factor 2 family protein [Candidatus Eremiobacteraeota bacterium]
MNDDAKFRRLVFLTLSFALAVAASGVEAFASNNPGVMATVNQFIGGLNKGDVKTADAACAPRVSIIDEFPPYAWQGANACSYWVKAYVADAKKEGITDGNVTLGAPWRVDVTGDRAYVVVPATYAYKQHGKGVTESNAVFTVALRKGLAAWRITGWTWSRH